MNTRKLKTLELEAASGSLAKYAGQLDGEPLVITCHRRPIAALVPIEGMDVESLSIGTNPEFLNLIERARRRRLTEGTVSEEEIRRELGAPANGQE